MKISSSDVLSFLTQTLVEPEIYPQQVLHTFSKVFGFEKTVFWTGVNGLELKYPIFRGIEDRMVYEYCEVYKNICPLYPKSSYELAYKNRVLTVKDLITPVDSHYYTDIYFDFGKKYSLLPMLSLFIFDNNRTLLGAVGINRHPDERDFDKSEVDMLRLLTRHISQTVICNRISINTLYPETGDSSQSQPIGVVIIDDSLNVQSINASAMEMLHEVLPTIKTNELVRNILDSIIPPIKFPLISNEERVLMTPNSKAYKLYLEPAKSKGLIKDGSNILYILRKFPHQVEIDQNIPIKSLYNLTRRECEVVSLVKKGYSNQQIADELTITLRTVKAHLQNIYEKTGVNNRSKLVYKLS